MTTAETSEREERIAAQRRSLPDAPGVYLFRDAKRRVLYVGKASSLKKRVASHFSNPSTKGSYGLLEEIEHIEFIVTETEAEALLAEQNFIKQYRPRYNVRLRDDKSYPYIGISLDEDFPRVYFTREKHRSKRAYFGPYSNAKRVRETLDLLGKVFQHRSCDGAEPGRASGSPCLDYFIKRCGAPCVGYVSKEQYRESIDSIIDFLSGRYRRIERELEENMQEAAAEQEFEQAAMYRNRLKAVRSLLERQRISNTAVGTLDAIAVAAEGTDANAQVFQLRDGVLADRQSFYLENEAGRDEGEVAEEFMLQYYASSPAIPPQVIVSSGVGDIDAIEEALAERRGGPVEVRHAERGDKRRIFELALRNARLALDQDRLRSEHRRIQRVEALDQLQRELGMEQLPMRIECFDISNLGETHTVASMVVFEGGGPKKSDYRRFAIRDAVQDDFAAMNEVLSRRMAQYVAQRERSPHEKSYDASFASLPALIVIDGGRGQLSAGLKALQPFR
ncbi:MAG: excinuclease subunit, partial [Thermoleophilaceae bacterium]|nr:excinuclease subunit [Thermoleophilaceae bacterium]